MTDKTLPRLSTYANFDAFRSALIDRFDRETVNTESGSMDMTILEWAFDHINDVDGMEKPFFEFALETISCAGCHAPQGLIYNHDIADKFPAWWDEIDSVLASFKDETGEPFTPETCGALVWFAVEYRAHELASLLRNEWDLEA